uniref:Uncharacterized protein n=1 Tax=Anguilla anguilla TaxID=7936 RepID=A0A0E9RQ76_ANGAN
MLNLINTLLINSNVLKLVSSKFDVKQKHGLTS